ncbi:hypothetical protein CAPTEDRAFT_195933 [Capitella teleta]|uniref:G-protein coupled receptors family 1 profile domain-containing protein n=1 Tax=Capitella teleta TaxID=283909 RepID=R7UTP6_CAPTE|nr:hypothetical protein CAPTEDRAFT_195933 [Capitella teleta]|eukprot:ELU07297.1 hypothetical protein CAPTEDRAFT_195933 [Capitella teleta]
MSLFARPLCVLLFVIAVGRHSCNFTTENIATVAPDDYEIIWEVDMRAIMKVTNAINSYAYVVLGFLAITTNTMNLIVMKRQPSVSPYTYLTALAACDLMTGLTMLWNGMISSVELQRISETVVMLMRKTFVASFFGRDCLSFASTLLTVALSLDRMVAVKFPLKRNLWCTVKRARFISVCLLVFSFLTNIDQPFRLTTVGIPDQISGKILPRVTYTPFGWRKDVTQAALYATLTLKMALPLMVMAASNTVTLRQIALSHKFRSQQAAKSGQSSKSGDQCLAVTIGVIVTFIITTLPRLAFKIVTIKKSSITSMASAITFVSAEVMAWTTTSSNFVIYCLLNDKFRRDATDLIGCKHSTKQNDSGKASSLSVI